MWTGQEFEENLRKDWAYLCNNSLVGPAIQHHLKHALCTILSHYEAQGHIRGWEVADFQIEHDLRGSGFSIRGYAAVRAMFPHALDTYQVVLGFDSDYPMYEESPPKPIDRWEAIALEIEDEVSLHKEELKQKDGSNTRHYVVNGNMPFIVPFEK